MRRALAHYLMPFFICVLEFAATGSATILPQTNEPVQAASPAQVTNQASTANPAQTANSPQPAAPAQPSNALQEPQVTQTEQTRTAPKMDALPKLKDANWLVVNRCPLRGLSRSFWTFRPLEGRLGYDIRRQTGLGGGRSLLVA